jgi:phosphoribosylaminoimidazole carboxylase PurE protein
MASNATPLIGIVTGSDSDFPFIKPMIETLRTLEIPFEVTVASAHRTPERVRSFIQTMEQSAKVIIAVAGGAAHLPGVVAGETLLPVIGVPVPTSFGGGLDSLLSISQMPKGIPVATVTTGSAGPMNAALLAARILATADASIAQRYQSFHQNMKQEVVDKADRLREIGFDAYVQEKE